MTREFFYFINPIARFGIRKYSFFFPLLTSLAIYTVIEILWFTVIKNVSLYSSLVIVTSIGLILYFSFRDALKGGFLTTLITVFYYFFIIFSHHYKGAQFTSGIQTAIILGLIYFAMGGLIGYLRYLLDILIEREREAKIVAENNQKRLSGVLQQLPLGVLIVDKERRIEGNKQLEKFLGKKMGKYLQRSEYASLLFEDGKTLSENSWPITRALLKGEIVISEEMEYVRKDKKHTFLRVNAAPVRDRRGRIIAAVSTIDDITEKKQEEEAKYRLAAVIESSGDAILSKTLGGIITSWNKGAEDLFGYTVREAIGKNINLIVPKKLRKHEEQMLEEIKNEKIMVQLETLRLKKGGQTIPVSMRASPIKNSKGEVIGISNIIRDIVAQKELEKQKDNFIATASHELKTPLTSLKGFAQILQVFATKRNDENSLLLLNRMNTQISKLTNLIGDLLDITKIQSGKLPLTFSFFDFNQMLQETVESMQLTTDTHTITLQGKIKKMVYGDEERIGQVITNLISNAIKYSPNAHEIIIKTRLKNSMALTSVQDFGIGIPKMKLKSVFRKFFRVSGSQTETLPGLGLGLYISNEIVKRLHGKIWVESKEGKGSTFYLEISTRKRKIV